MSTGSLNVIRPDELEEINAHSIGNGVFANCFLKKFKRLGINVVEKQLIDNNIAMLYKEALSMQNSHTDVFHCCLESSWKRNQCPL